MSLRKLALEDLANLMLLDACTNLHPWSQAQWQDSLQQHHCLGLFSEGDLTAFAVVMPLPDEAELLLIAVRPQLQGQGLGQRLLSAIFEQMPAQKWERILLELRSSNKQALRFYEAAGFVQIGLRKLYYPCANGREDAIVMARSLE